MNKWSLNLLIVGLSAMGTLGCTSSDTSPSASQGSGAPDSKYVVKAEPQGAVEVGTAKESAEDNEDLVLVGRIGGSAEPFVDGMAAFTIVDRKVPHCSDDEGCPTPWDYCCEQNQVKDNIATVKIVGADGKPVAKDARELLGVKELSTVVVHGKAKRDTDGNLAVLADQVFLKE
jgi:hypothetical protein